MAVGEANLSGCSTVESVYLANIRSGCQTLSDLLSQGFRTHPKRPKATRSDLRTIFGEKMPVYIAETDIFPWNERGRSSPVA